MRRPSRLRAHRAAAAPLLAALLVPAPADAQCGAVAAGEIRPADNGPLDSLGYDVAVDGPFAVVGSPFEDVLVPNDGAVHVFHRETPDLPWTEVKKLWPVDVFPDQHFGKAVAVSGGIVLANAFRFSKTAPAGAAYVFEHVGPGLDAWAQKAKLVDPRPGPGQHYGWALDVDGDLVAVGSHLDDVAAPDAGVVHVYRRHGGLWLPEAELLASSPRPGAQLGMAVQIEGDRIVVGAPLDDEAGPKAGAVHVFERKGGAWVETAKLLPELPAGEDRFGWTLALDGERLAVGAITDDAVGVDAAGAVCVLEHGPGGWAPVASLLPPEPEAWGSFGDALALSGSQLAVGQPQLNTVKINNGAVFTYHRDHGGPGAWGRTGTIVEPPTFHQGGDQAGWSVALAGAQLLVGVPGFDLACYDCGEGAVRLYELDPDPPVAAAPASVSLLAGGAQTIAIDEGPCAAGLLSWVVGTTSGTAPGLDVGGWLVPLNPDPYLVQTVVAPDALLVDEGLAVLGARGERTAEVVVRAGTSPALAGLVLHHVALVVDPATFAVLDASDPVALELLP